MFPSAVLTAVAGAGPLAVVESIALLQALSAVPDLGKTRDRRQSLQWILFLALGAQWAAVNRRCTKSSAGAAHEPLQPFTRRSPRRRPAVPGRPSRRAPRSAGSSRTPGRSFRED